MRVFKRVLSLFVIVSLFCGLMGCSLSDEQKRQQAENEKTAKPILEQFCEDNFESYKIADIQGYHYTDYDGLFPTEVLTALVCADVNVKKKSFKLYYDITGKEFYTDYYNTEIEKQIKDSLLEIIPKPICKAKIEFFPTELGKIGLTVVKIKDNKFENNFTEIFFSENNFSKDYEINIVGHYDNIDRNYFNKETIESKRELLNRYCSVHLTNAYKCSQNYNISDIDNIKDSLSYNTSDGKIDIRSYKRIDCDDFILIYDKNSISGIEVTSEENTAKKPDTTRYPNYEFVSSNKEKYTVSIFGRSQEQNTGRKLFIRFKKVSDSEYCNFVDSKSKNMVKCSHYSTKYDTVYLAKDIDRIEMSFWTCINKNNNN